MNTEGRVQRGEKAAFPPGEAREDWAILRAVSRAARQAAAVRQLRPAARSRCSRNIRSSAREGLIDLPWSPPKLSAKAEGPIAYPIRDFFLTNAICRNSPTMRICSEELVHGVEVQEAAE